MSAIIAAALEGPQGDALPSSLLGASGDGLRVLAFESEVSVLKSRFDVLVVYED